MSTNPLSPWLELGKSTLEMFKQLGAASSAGVKEAGSQVPLGQAELAQLIKSTLEMSKELNELQKSACFSLFQAQLGNAGQPLPSKTVQDLFDMHLDFSTNLCGQWKDACEKIVERASCCVGDLRKAQTGDDVSFIVSGFLRDVGARLRKDVEESGVLVNSASAAASSLTHQALDEMIGVRSAAPDA